MNVRESRFTAFLRQSAGAVRLTSATTFIGSTSTGCSKTEALSAAQAHGHDPDHGDHSTRSPYPGRQLSR